ncbi:MAG TPA: toll/interleukin-1 receptor domain-containing protein [Caulobacterales bacterium]|nr:toll/interleukin-1 receptor domain-containing protein [Caulobacterales bacterium]
MANVVVIAAAADQDAALALAQALTEAGLNAAVKTAAGPAPPRTHFVLFCVTQAALKDAALIGMLWREAPMAEDPTGRFMFAVFDDAAGSDNFAPFLKRHFSAPGGDSAAFAAHIAAHQDKLAEAAKAAEERIQEIMREAAARPASEEREGIGSGRTPDRPMGVGAGDSGSVDRRIEIMRKAEQAPRTQIFHETSPARAAPPAGNQPLTSMDKMLEGAPPPAPSAPAPSSVRYSARTKAPPGKLDKVDARAFAPKKLRRGASELIRVAVFRPKDKDAAKRAARQADARASTAGAAQHLGKIARGAMVAAVIDARGANVEETRIEAEWGGDPLDFNFIVTPHDDAAQALITIRILADDAQVGSIVFVRPLAKAHKSGQSSKLDSEEKLRRVERAFLSYSSADRDTVSLIASAYQRAGIPCFFDRSGLASGEEWSPRLVKEIERADLFHLCWSRQAAASQWVQKETEHAMIRRRKAKKPEITIQMLDGPPWAPHPANLDALNFDDYARAAIVGYARGDGGS